MKKYSPKNGLWFLSNWNRLTWFFRQRRRQFIGLATNTSVLPTVIVGALTVLVTIFLTMAWSPNGQEPKWVFTNVNWYLINGLFIVFLILTVLLGRFFFYSQTPNFYAQFSIEKSPISESFMYISYCIWKECKFWNRYNELIDKYISIYNNQGDIDNCDISKEDIKIVKKLAGTFDKRYDKIQRIDYMLVSLSKMMNIPANRLSDHLFHFSPEIYNHELRATIRMMKDIINLQSNSQDKYKVDSKDRIYRMSEKIMNFRNMVSQRKIFQERILENSHLHNSLIDISTGFGMSNSFAAYALGLQIIVNKKKNDKDIGPICRQLKFLYTSRKIYSGFDLHTALLNFAKRSEKSELILALRDMSSLSTSSMQKSFGRYYNSFSNLSGDIDTFTKEQRKNINRKFVGYFRDNIVKDENKNKENIVIVTQGYSTVVNDALHTLATAMSNVFLTDFQYIFREKQIFYYIIKSPSQVESTHQTISRYVRYKFKENPNIPAVSGGKINVKVGDLKWLKNRFRKDDTLFLVLSGAEFYQIDTNKKESRILNDEGIYRLFESSKFDKKGFKHIVLGESSKHYDFPISDPDLKTGLSGDHFEFIHLYKWSSSRVIISGNQDSCFNFEEFDDNDPKYQFLNLLK